MESIWTKTSNLSQGFLTMEDGEHLETETAVIGGGMAGILTAYYLQQSGQKVIVLEAGQVGCGQTCNTTAKITLQHGLIYDNLIRHFGTEKALQYITANREAIKHYETLITQLDIHCGFERCPAFLYTTEDAGPLEAEKKALEQLGTPARLTKDTELPLEVEMALEVGDQAVFHPLQFLYGIAAHLSVYQHTFVRSIEDSKIITNQGTVTAKHIVMATHYPFINTPGYYFLRMHQERSYVLALENAADLHGIYYGIDKDGYSFRNYGPLLLLGGSGHRTGRNPEGGQYGQLREAARKFYPDSKETAHWSAQDCMALDHVPYIGSFSASLPNLYVATGFNKWGMTSSMAAAQILSGYILGAPPAYGEIFSPARFNLPASTKNLIKDGTQSFKGLALSPILPARASVDDLSPGDGGIVDCDGEKIGVYKNGNGEVFTVSPYCTHLGCQLEWNPEELTWDCPCHGSRFNYTGELISNPAMKGLEK